MANITNLAREVNIHKTMLLIGAGETVQYLNEITYFESVESVAETFGGDLANAYSQARSLGAEYVFTMNVQRPADYLKAAESLCQYDFTYIVPISLTLDQGFYDPGRGREVSYAHMFVESMSGCNNSTVIMCGRHASLYETLDDLLEHMNSVCQDIRSSVQQALPGNNLVALLNNLTSYSMSNVPLAASLCSSDIPEHPAGPFGAAVFDVDLFDVGDQEYGFFKNNTNRDTTAEHLVNFDVLGPTKLLAVDRIVKFIVRELDLSGFIGRLFSSYTKIKVLKRLEEFLDAMIGYVIYDYQLGEILWETSAESPGSGILTVGFSLWPVHSVEKIDVVTSKEAGTA